MRFAKIFYIYLALFARYIEDKRHRNSTKQVNTRNDLGLKKDPSDTESLSIERHGFASCKCVCARVYIYMYMYVCIYIHIYIHLFKYSASNFRTILESMM